MSYEYGLKENYNVRIDNRILTLLKKDAIIFNQKSLNNLINNIVLTYLEIRDSDDISRILLNEVKNKFKNKFNTQELEDLEMIFKEKIYKTTFLKSNTKEMSHSSLLNFRLNNKTRKECQKFKKKQDYFDTEFFRAIFEWYTIKPKYQREKILFSDNFEIVKDAIDNEYEVILKIKDQAHSIHSMPVGYFHTKEENYNYILTLGKNINTGKDMIFPTRLSNILSVEPNTREKFDSSTFSNELRDKIKEKIETKNYTWSEVEEIKIKFTKNGRLKYDQIQHLRPEPIETEDIDNDDVIMTFKEPLDIILYYFIQFGSNIEVLSPINLREKFKDIYKNAFEIYI